jgi:tetratricopeptide (TPR) repeat protein
MPKGTINDSLNAIKIIFSASLLLALGVFAYNQYLNPAIDNQKQSKTTTDYKEQFYEVSYEGLDQEVIDLIKSSSLKIENTYKLSLKKDISANERSEAKALLASSVMDAKKATVLAPDSAVVWLNMGDIYRSLNNTAKDANKWAIESYENGIKLDPDNYIYHERIGGIHLASESYEEAIEEFIQVTKLTSGYANGYYNLGYAYKAYGAKTRAVEAFKKCLELLPADHPDRYKAEAELENI